MFRAITYSCRTLPLRSAINVRHFQCAAVTPQAVAEGKAAGTVMTANIAQLVQVVATEPVNKTTPARKPSAAPKGTVLKGINFLKDGKDPVALDDAEYPDWLWDLLDEKKQRQKTSKSTHRQYHRKQNRDAIKAMNFMKDKKT
ncbi:hypothetical protein EC973_000907 [Apophysomyces ossiformis]|uniref:Large ribosomal subunit protein mL54 n=1 Tax=Apophysomyces ossiformis TaxID=679940 RepID=A0A8H7BQ02_9FUNG|nr:hypothetical protein EC973_000907 [Apophysomyces ossiformis]